MTRKKIEAAAIEFHMHPSDRFTEDDLVNFAIARVNEALEEAAKAIERLEYGTAVMVIRSFKVTP